MSIVNFQSQFDFCLAPMASINALADVVPAQSNAISIIAAAAPAWRGYFAILLFIIALASLTNLLLYGQRKLLNKRSSFDTIVIWFFLASVAAAACLWPSALFIKAATLPQNGFIESRPFFQSVALSGSLAILMSAAVFPLLGYFDRFIHEDQIHARRALTKLGIPSLAMAVAICILVEPFLLFTNKARPSNEDIHMISPLWMGMIALAIMLMAASSAMVAITQNQSEKLKTTTSPGLSRTALAIAFVIALPLSFLLFRIGMTKLAISDETAPWLNRLGGASDQTIAGQFIRWSLLFTCVIIATTLTAKKVLARTPIETSHAGKNRTFLPKAAPLTEITSPASAPLHSTTSTIPNANATATPLAMSPRTQDLDDSANTAAPHASSLQTDAPAFWRWLLLLALLAYLIMTWYASLIPLKYVDISWDQAVERFKAMRDFNVTDSANRRADWVANIVLFIPISFLAMGVLTLRNRSHFLKVIASLIVFAFGAAMACAIEFVQVWYPIRTVSQNDLVAEFIGTLIGIIIWAVVGHGITRRLAELCSGAHGALARQRLLQFYAIGLVLFCLLPMDFTLSPEKISAKINTIQFGQSLFDSNLLMGLARILRDLCVFAPLGALALYHWDKLPILGNKLVQDSQNLERGIAPANRTVLHAAGVVLIIVAAIEILKISMVNGLVDLINIPVRSLAGLVGATVASTCLGPAGTFLVGRAWSRLTRMSLALLLIAIHIIILAGVLVQPWNINFDKQLYDDQITTFSNGLFTNYYYSGEWTALTNLTHYFLLFVPLGVLLHWGIGKTASRYRWALLMLPLLIGTLLGLSVELSQALTPREVVHITEQQVTVDTKTFQQQAIDVSDPKLSKGKHLATGPMADMTDLLAYIAGTCAGWLFMGVFLAGDSTFTQQKPHQEPRISSREADNDSHLTHAANVPPPPGAPTKVTSPPTSSSSDTTTRRHRSRDSHDLGRVFGKPPDKTD
jgi:VanZ family protein